MNTLTTNDTSVILNPTIINIGGCRFRRYHQPKTVPVKTSNVQLGPYLDNDDDMVNCSELDDGIEVEMINNGRYMSQFHVAPAFYGTIIGAKGSRKREIEMDTDTSIWVPKKGESAKIKITGNSERNVVTAHMRVQMLVLQQRENKKITHFISIRVTSEEIWKNFAQFKEIILNGPPLRGVDETVFQAPGKLHLTIAPLVLLDDIETEIAVAILHNYRDSLCEIFKNSGPLRVVLKGLEIMNDDPTDVDVLYGKVQLNVPKYNTQFQKMADKIVELLSKQGLMRRQYESVKLHVTLMNSLFRKRAQETTNREPFDASHIMKNFRDYYFGEAQFNDVSLVIRFTTADDKFYERLTTITL